MTQYTWTIESLDCAPAQDGHTDVVRTVHWRCTGVDTLADREYTGTVYSTCTLPAPATDSDLTAYPDLTQQQVLEWIWSNGVDREATEANVEQQIAAQISPPIVQPPLPW